MRVRFKRPCTLLESWGYSVITAGSYDETLRKVVTRPERPGG